MMTLSENFIAVPPCAGVHISTIRRFTDNPKALMKFIANAAEYDIEDPDELNRMCVESALSIEEYIRLTKELAEIQLAVATLLEGGAWPADEPQPVFVALREDSP